jgi:copper(I)-binding protein
MNTSRTAFSTLIARGTFVTFATFVTLLPTLVLAQTSAAEPSLKITDAWLKTTVPGGSVSAAYMQISSAKPLKLIKAESPLTPNVEIHNMSMKEGVMEMRAVDAVDVPANKTVSLKPGGFHIMLIKVKQPINKGDSVPLKLTFETPDKKFFSVDVAAKGQEKAGEKAGEKAAGHAHH